MTPTPPTPNATSQLQEALQAQLRTQTQANRFRALRDAADERTITRAQSSAT